MTTRFDVDGNKFEYNIGVGNVEVRMNGKIIGTIKQENAPADSQFHLMWRYWPTGAKKLSAAGAAYPSIAKVMNSLEGKDQ